MADVQTDQVETPETDAELQSADTEVSELSEMEQLKAEVDKWKSLSRKNEQQAKSNMAAAKELEDIRKSQLTETEKLIEQTRTETAQSVRKEFATKLVDAELKAHLSGRVVDSNALLSFEKSAFITDDGNIDSEAIQSWVEAHSKETGTPAPDLGQGARGKNPSKTQIRTRDELANMSPAEILQARTDGRLDTLMGKL
jgi:wobble nucleotide-excising tRNase